MFIVQGSLSDDCSEEYGDGAPAHYSDTQAFEVYTGYVMKRVLLIIFLTVYLGGSAQAGLVAFDFSGLTIGATEAEIGAAMTAQYGSGVTVVGATTDDMAGGYIEGIHLIDTQTDGLHSFSISFDEVPISGVSFDWRRQQDEFVLDVMYTDGTWDYEVFWDRSPGSDGGSASGPGEWISFDSPFVSQLLFHDSNKGFIEIGNLVVSAVPLPGSVLLGAFAVGLAGWKFRTLV